MYFCVNFWAICQNSVQASFLPAEHNLQTFYFCCCHSRFAFILSKQNSGPSLVGKAAASDNPLSCVLFHLRGAISSFCAAYRITFYLRQSAGRYNRSVLLLRQPTLYHPCRPFSLAALVLAALLPVCSVSVLLFAPVLPSVPAACHSGGHSVPRLPPKLPSLQSKQLRKGLSLVSSSFQRPPFYLLHISSRRACFVIIIVSFLSNSCQSYLLSCFLYSTAFTAAKKQPLPCGKGCFLEQISYNQFCFILAKHSLQ